MSIAKRNFSLACARDSYLFPLGNIRESRHEFSWPSTSTFYAKRLCDVRFEDTWIRGFPAKSFRHRARTATSLVRS